MSGVALREWFGKCVVLLLGVVYVAWPSLLVFAQLVGLFENNDGALSG